MDPFEEFKERFEALEQEVAEHRATLEEVLDELESFTEE